VGIGIDGVTKKGEPLHNISVDRAFGIIFFVRHELDLELDLCFGLQMETTMLEVEFDRTIESDLPPQELWRLMKEAFEDPSRSPIWPVELDEVNPVELRLGAEVTATYRFGPVKAQPSYYVTEFEAGKSFSYESYPDHPLEGGATVEVLSRDGASALRWRGAYRPRLHPAAPGALAFVRLYFLRTFFSRLKANLRRYEERFVEE
jgi:hypothetical protein